MKIEERDTIINRRKEGAMEAKKRRRLERIGVKERMEKAMTSGLRIVFDCSFHHLMNNKVVRWEEV